MATIGGGEKPVRDALLGSGASQGTGSFAGVETNKLLYQDVQALKEGDLGLSEAEKDQMAQAQQAAAAQQAQAQQEELNRQQMASGGGYSGRYAETARELGAEAGEAGAAARSEADRVSREQAEARRSEILQRLERQQDINIDRRRYMNESHNKRAENIASIFSMMTL